MTSGEKPLVLVATTLLLFCSCTTSSPSPTAPAIVAGGTQTEADGIARSNLIGGLRTAEAYFRKTGSFTGFGPLTAARLAPDRVWRGDAGASRGVITINHAHDRVLVMSTASASGARYCVGVSGRTRYFGTRDAAGADQAESCGSATHWPSPSSPSPLSPAPVG